MNRAARLLLPLFLALGAACSDWGKNRGKGGVDPSIERLALAHRQLGQGYMRDEQYRKALEAFERAREVLPNDPDAYTMLGVLHGQLGNAGLAEENFREALEISPENPSILNNYGRFLCNQGDRRAEGIAHFLTAANDPLYERPEIAWTNAGLCVLDEGNPALARQYLEEALKKVPEFPNALFQLAKLSLNAGEFRSGRDFLQRYENVAPISAASLWLGVRLERGLGNPNEAGKYGRLLVQNFPSSKETLEYQSLVK